MPNLLTHLVPSLTNRVEDMATEALAFILNQSEACRHALDGLLRDNDFNPGPISRIETQVTDGDRSRPDMVGYDQNDAKRLLVESKFWAGLQEDQASRYFGRLESTGWGVLLFIAPDSRIDTLWTEIKRQMTSGQGSVQLAVQGDSDRIRRARIVGSEMKRLMLVSWDQLLNNMATAAAADARLTSDIEQLRGLARYQDEEAFQPIHPREFGLALPRRIRGLNRLIDDVVQTRDWMRAGSAASQREGYGRYFTFALPFADVPGRLFLCVNYMRWAANEETPLWLWINSEVPVNVNNLRQHVPSLVEEGNIRDVPIFLQTGVEYDRVVDDVVRQLKEIREMIETH